ncbi:hypothetical protein F5Y19DRAFT_424359 [Xylariaceae sp. FL1651]|nr:hypothetical protein F5Y19DRAFT_424359 [Xylariaceae sp. FL1651]
MPGLPFHPSGVAANLGRQRLLMDIEELVTKPYPKIMLHPHEEDLSSACLLLFPEYYPPLHLNISFPSTYPICPPVITMDSSIIHPNVYGQFICASILHRGDEYTPAYTLKGIAIQLLSFFDSDSLEQEDYDGKKNLADYRSTDAMYFRDAYKCNKCQFGLKPATQKPRTRSSVFDALVSHNPEEWPTLQNIVASDNSPSCALVRTFDDMETSPEHEQRNLKLSPVTGRKNGHNEFSIDQLPNEILLLIIERLDDFEHLTRFAQAWPRISHLMREFDVIRQRELQCFCLKKSYQSVKLGVGVSVDHRGQISSEFDLISEQAYRDLNIRCSIQNINFEYWLPLPISRHHWNQVRGVVRQVLFQIRPLLRTAGTSEAQVLFTFMNDIVVRLNQATEHARNQPSQKSTLRHASEKAIESYFHLFHLLVCLAIENPDIVRQANQLLQAFESGRQSKVDCPNLGHLLIALLISDVQVTEKLLKSIITEAITRNVVWLLDCKGAGMAELSYIERDAVSAYRLNRTFQGSRTSYRLLMFSELFRRTARPSHKKPLSQVRDELFDRHGAPPRDTASLLAAEVRRLQAIDNFPAFLKEMGLPKIPTSENFTAVLKDTVRASMAKGYSKWALSQKKAMHLRIRRDPFVQLTEEERKGVIYLVECCPPRNRHRWSFFPDDGTRHPGGGKGHGRRHH